MKSSLNYIIVAGIGALFILIVPEITRFFAKSSYDPTNFKVQTVNWETVTKQINEYQVQLEAKLRAEIKPRTRVIVKTDTIRPNIDSLFSQAKEYWKKKVELEQANYDFIAEVDTAFAIKDTSKNISDSLSIKFEYISPIPLHPNGYFRSNISHISYTKTKFQETRIVTPREKSFFDRFNTVIYTGVGYDFVQKIPTVSVGIGIGINIKSLF